MYIYKDHEDDEVVFNDNSGIIDIQITPRNQEDYLIVELPHKELPELIKYLQEAYDANNTTNNTP